MQYFTTVLTKVYAAVGCCGRSAKDSSTEEAIKYFQYQQLTLSPSTADAPRSPAPGHEYPLSLLPVERAEMQSYPSPTPIAADSGGPFYPSSSNQPHADSSADDLQLSAQLSRGIAPMMNAGSGGPMAEGQGSRAQDNANHQFEHEQDVRRHAHMHQGNHSPIDHMGAQYSPQDGSVAPRKRSKVSRACDECRRKKIRCDATGDPGDEQCSSCKRTAARCQFSRVPMKRGPSKGYLFHGWFYVDLLAANCNL